MVEVGLLVVIQVGNTEFYKVGSGLQKLPTHSTEPNRNHQSQQNVPPAAGTLM